MVDFALTLMKYHSPLLTLLHIKPSVAAQHKSTEILIKGALFFICLSLTACTSRLTQTLNIEASTPTPIKGSIASPTPFLPESTQSPIPTKVQLDTPTLSSSQTHTPVFLQTATPTSIDPVPSASFLPEIEQVPLSLNPVADITTLPIAPLTITTTIVMGEPPTPSFSVEAKHIPIIEYHYSEYNVDNRVMMTTGWFENQISWLADNGYTTLSASDLIDYLNGDAFPQKSVVLSFDLGTAQKANFSNVIIPTLEKYKFTALFFLLVNDHVITDSCNNTEKFCWDDLRHWQQEGIVSVESHGISHADYDTLTADQMRWDAGQANNIISTRLGTAPLGFAYPYDSIPGQAPKVIESIGYQFAVGGPSRSNRSVETMDADRYSLPRVYPYSNMSIYPVIGGSQGKTFDQMITGYIFGQ
jgi:peptidoglycan/xylan/chitin deacetylase (PgdA/CDA1 family)